jgi:hypothetical protein
MEEEFDIAGKKVICSIYEFLQQVIVITVVSVAVYYRKLRKLRKYSLVQLYFG